MALGRLVSAASEIASPMLDAVRTLTDSPADRRSWAGHGRIHLEVRGMHRPGTEEAARALERRLTEVEHVHSAEVNAALGRVVIFHGAEPVAPTVLTDVIAEVEREHGLESSGYAPASARHPGNAAPVLREVGALATSLTGIGYTAITSLLPVRTLPPLLPTALSLTDSVPWIRSTVESRFGRPATDTALALGTTVAQTLAQQPLPLFIATCQRFCTAQEAFARNQAWRRWERTTGSRPGSHRTEPVETPPRPGPLPDGPVEYVANISGALALAGYGTASAIIGSPQRARALLQAGLPRASKAGREAFAAHLAGTISTRGDLILEPDTLRRLDRVDTVVLDAPILLTGRQVVDTVIPVDQDDDPTALFHRADELLDPQRPREHAQHGDWAVAPVGEVTEQLPEHARDTAREQAEHGGNVLALSYRSHPVALVRVVAELDPYAEALAGAARGAGTVLVAGLDGHLDRRLSLDGAVAGGNRLLNSIGELQADGRAVALVSARGHAALAAADIGLGIPAESGAVPWNAHVLCSSPAHVGTLLAAADNARTLSRRSAALSATGSGLGALLAALGPELGADSRASMPVHAATLCALGLGTFSGMQAAGRPALVEHARIPRHAIALPPVPGTQGTSRQ
ncbi:hypothetical protein DFQ14_102296 [Halopolyspora algeriensis]|uniref:HMA domain-containing protein n=1 Tax=Halopolyspora algeriensis TaxID=1500506 RepID=A0A368VV76_9ACTN|nr:heavy metal-associated domain-containing protein [Halopolyspora algeriensis]RCW45994.1 hypothetical protein DFQ14_102296 [Halopolyspora algeriensis]TQM55407.1 hypothetical protein FHU43_0170 [Halopolyspora algeriensis]